MEYCGALDLSGLGPDVTPEWHPRMVWQSIVDLATGDVIGYEALARFGDVAPTVMFDYAVEQGLGVDLDSLCVTTALTHPPRKGLVFLNLTPATIRSGRFPALPEGFAERVVWELPEGSGWAPRHLPTSVVVALDDVGSGFAELLRLTEVPWRFVKADRSLVHAVATQRGHQAIVRDLVQRARDRGGAVIAEGVEVPADAAWLAQAGVAYGQGFLWGRPRIMEE